MQSNQQTKGYNTHHVMEYINKNFILLLDKVVLLFCIYAFYMEVWSHNYGFYGGFPPIYGIYFVFIYGICRLILWPDKFKSVSKLGFFWWLFFFVLLMTANYIIVYFGLYHKYEDYLQGEFNKGLTALGFMLSIVILLVNRSNFQFVLKVLPFAVIAGCFINFIDILDFSEKWGGLSLRGAGYYSNPNSSGRALSLGFIVTVFSVKKKYVLPYFLIYLFGTFCTLSRGSIPIIFLIGIYLIFIGSINLKGILISFVSIVIVFFVLTSVVLNNDNLDLLVSRLQRNTQILNRVNTFVNPTGTKFQTGVRDDVALDHFRFFAQSPIVGHGMSSSRYAQKNFTKTNHSSHVMYIYMLNEYGLLGMLILLGLPLSLFYFEGHLVLQPELFFFAIIFLISGLASHNLFDLRSLLFCYGLFAVYIMHAKDQEKTTIV